MKEHMGSEWYAARILNGPQTRKGMKRLRKYNNFSSFVPVR